MGHSHTVLSSLLLTPRPCVQVSGINSLLTDLRAGLKKLRATILQPAEQLSDMVPADRAALDLMVTFHQDSKATFLELEVGI